MFLFTVALQILLVCIASAAEKTQNVLFILADDLGWADTTLYGHTKFYQTPNLERLASRGMTFNRAYTSSPLCSPTRSAILTGLHPARTGLTTPGCHTGTVRLEAKVAAKAKPGSKLLAVQPVNRLDARYQTLSKTLKANGYTTGHFGKWHLGAEPYSALEHGFDIDIPHWHGPGPAGSFVAPWKFPDFKEKVPKEHLEDRMGDEAVAFMEAHADRPFFLNYWQFSVHAPFDARAELIEKHRKRIDPQDAQRSPTYAAMVESLDDNIGKMLDALDRLALSDDTIIVFTSDNGGNMYNEIDGTTPTSNRPLRGGKGNNWDGGVRVPTVVVWPREIEPGTRCDTLITSTDFYPTILAMLGIEAQPGQKFDGVDFTAALRGQEFERDPIFTYFPHSTKVPDTLPPSVAVYHGDWKLLRLFHNRDDGSHEHRLFNLKSDMGEHDDLAATHTDQVKLLSARVDAFLSDCKAVTPVLNHASRPSSGVPGWRNLNECTLERQGGRLFVRTKGTDPHLQVRFDSPLPAGDAKIEIVLKANIAGRIEARWQELGARPPFHRSRLTRSENWRTGETTSISLSYNAKHPVPSVRFDFPPGEALIEIDRVEFTAGKRRLARWDFSE